MSDDEELGDLHEEGHHAADADLQDVGHGFVEPGETKSKLGGYQSRSLK